MLWSAWFVVVVFVVSVQAERSALFLFILSLPNVVLRCWWRASAVLEGAMAGLNPHLQLLLADQQGAHVGQGGRPQAMPDEERAALLAHAKHNKPQNVPVPFTAAPEDVDAADSPQ